MEQKSRGQILVNFTIIDIGESYINYRLISSGSLFKITRTGWHWKKQMSLHEAVESIIHDIRNLRAANYSEPHSNLDITALLDREDKMKLPEYYKVHVNTLVEKINQGANDFRVTARKGKAFVDNNTIYFDNAFMLDIENLGKLN